MRCSTRRYRAYRGISFDIAGDPNRGTGQTRVGDLNSECDCEERLHRRPMIPPWGIRVNRGTPAGRVGFCTTVLPSGPEIYAEMTPPPTLHLPMAQRFAASIAAAALLLQVLAPAAAIAIEARHDATSAAHSSHHPGCPFDGKENCPHHRAAAGEPSFAQCSDAHAVLSGPASATLRLLVVSPVRLFSLPDATTTPATTILPMLAWHTMAPETPPPRVPASL